MLLRFAKKSPTSSPGVDIDVRRPNIDGGHVKKCWHISGTMRGTEMVNYFSESSKQMKFDCLEDILPTGRKVDENSIMALKTVSKV